MQLIKITEQDGKTYHLNADKIIGIGISSSKEYYWIQLEDGSHRYTSVAEGEALINRFCDVGQVKITDRGHQSVSGERKLL